MRVPYGIPAPASFFRVPAGFYRSIRVQGHGFGVEEQGEGRSSA